MKNSLNFKTDPIGRCSSNLCTKHIHKKLSYPSIGDKISNNTFLLIQLGFQGRSIILQIESTGVNFPEEWWLSGQLLNSYKTLRGKPQMYCIPTNCKKKTIRLHITTSVIVKIILSFTHDNKMEVHKV